MYEVIVFYDKDGEYGAYYEINSNNDYIMPYSLNNYWKYIRNKKFCDFFRYQTEEQVLHNFKNIKYWGEE